MIELILSEINKGNRISFVLADGTVFSRNLVNDIQLFEDVVRIVILKDDGKKELFFIPINRIERIVLEEV